MRCAKFITSTPSCFGHEQSLKVLDFVTFKPRIDIIEMYQVHTKIGETQVLSMATNLMK